MRVRVRVRARVRVRGERCRRSGDEAVPDAIGCCTHPAPRMTGQLRWPARRQYSPSKTAGAGHTGRECVREGQEGEVEGEGREAANRAASTQAGGQAGAAAHRAPCVAP